MENYIGENGLLYCSECNEPVQAKLVNPLTNEEMVVNLMCKCKEAELEAHKKKEEAEELERRRKVCFNHSNMASWNFANDDRSNAKISDAMQKYVDNFQDFKKQGKGLLLWGTVGTGKTYYACCIANALLEAGYQVYCTSLRDLVNNLQNTWEKNEYIEALNKYSLLVLDDLGAERSTDFMIEQIFSIIDSRYRSGLPFIVTTNLTMKQMINEEDIGYRRIYDRIIERCHPVEINGVSRRRLNVKDSFINTNEILGL
jgi:DNA replication protein DnaC